MSRAARIDKSVTLPVRLANGTLMPVRLSSDCIRFIGSYNRLPEYGMRGTLIHLG